jgi:very-short-patch-repair endonuclease
VDFYCHAAKVIVEVDGTVHERQAQADRERDQILTATRVGEGLGERS